MIATSRQDLEAYLWGAANLLRGLMDFLAICASILFPLLFFERLSTAMWDEDYHQAAFE